MLQLNNSYYFVHVCKCVYGQRLPYKETKFTFTGTIIGKIGCQCQIISHTLQKYWEIMIYNECSYLKLLWIHKSFAKKGKNFIWRAKSHVLHYNKLLVFNKLISARKVLKFHNKMRTRLPSSGSITLIIF